MVVVARHERAVAKYAEVLVLDHYLEVLKVKSGALARRPRWPKPRRQACSPRPISNIGTRQAADVGFGALPPVGVQMVGVVSHTNVRCQCALPETVGQRRGPGAGELVGNLGGRLFGNMVADAVDPNDSGHWDPTQARRPRSKAATSRSAQSCTPAYAVAG